MASVHREAMIDVSADTAWAQLRQVDQAPALFAPLLVEGSFDRDAETRTVRFANGMAVQERILDVDEDRRRVAYAVVDGGGLSYHHASMQIVEAGPGRCRFVWVSDFLPAKAEVRLAPLVEAGTWALKANLEGRSSSPTVLRPDAERFREARSRSRAR